MARLLLALLAAMAARCAWPARRLVVHVSSYGRRYEKIRIVLSSFMDQTLSPDLLYYSHACRDAEREARLGCADKSQYINPDRMRLCGRNCSVDGRAPFPFAQIGRLRAIAYVAEDRGPAMRILALRGPAAAGDLREGDLVVVGDDDKIYAPDLLARLSLAAGPRTAVGCRGWDYKGEANLDELAHSTYGYARMRYENRGYLLPRNSTRRVRQRRIRPVVLGYPKNSSKFSTAVKSNSFSTSLEPFVLAPRVLDYWSERP